MAFLRKFSDFSLNLSRLVFLWGRFGLSDVPFPDFLNGVPQKAFHLTFSSSLIQESFFVFLQ